MQDHSISSVLEREILQSCTKPSNFLQHAHNRHCLACPRGRGVGSLLSGTLSITIRTWWKCHFCCHLTLNGPIATCLCTGGMCKKLEGYHNHEWNYYEMLHILLFAKCWPFCCLPNAGHFVVCQMLAILLFAKCWPFCCLLQCVTSGLDISQCRTIRGKQTCHLGKWIWAKYYFKTYTDGLAHNWSISSVLAMEIIQSCTKPVLRKAITTIYIEQGKSEGFDSCDRPTIYIEQGKSEGFDSCDQPSIQMWWKCYFCSHLTLNGPIATCFCTGVVVCAKSWRDITTTNGTRWVDGTPTSEVTPVTIW